jgi:hypothetical protein
MAITPRLLWTQRQDIGPSSRAQHAMAYDGKRKRTILFGGSRFPYYTADNFSDTWEWDGEYWLQVSQFGPPPLAAHSMTYDVARERIVLYGNPGTWEWDGASWTQVADVGPGTNHAAMVYDGHREQVMLFGGWGDGGAHGDTWYWDGIEWTQESESGPAAHGSRERS